MGWGISGIVFLGFTKFLWFIEKNKNICKNCVSKTKSVCGTIAGSFPWFEEIATLIEGFWVIFMWDWWNFSGLRENGQIKPEDFANSQNNRQKMLTNSGFL